jgi:excisionase family DNA binding protein
MTETKKNRPFLDTRELAAYLGVNEKQVYTLIRDRGLPGTRITGKWLFPRHLVDRWVEASVANIPESTSLLDDAVGLLLIAGSDDPLLASLLNLYRERHPETLVLQSGAGSSEGMVALKRGLCHLAGVHLPDPRGGHSTDYLEEQFGDSAVVFTLATRKQGLLLPRGNPKNVSGLADAAGRDLKWSIRQTGTGTRALLERSLEANDLANGFMASGVPAANHLDTGIAVMTGTVDVGLAIEAVAVRLDLDFIPLAEERFDLVGRKDSWFEKPVQQLLDICRTDEVVETAAQLGGYDLSACGTLLK